MLFRFGNNNKMATNINVSDTVLCLYLANEFQLQLVAVHRSNGGYYCIVLNTLTSSNL